MVSMSEDSGRIWSVSEGKCLHELYSSSNKFQSCTFYPGFAQVLVIGSYEYVMILLNGGVPIAFSGTEAPAAYGELISIEGLGPSVNGKLSSTITEILQTKLSIDRDRFYIKFYDSPFLDHRVDDTDLTVHTHNILHYLETYHVNVEVASANRHVLGDYYFGIDAPSDVEYDEEGLKVISNQRRLKNYKELEKGMIFSDIVEARMILKYLDKYGAKS
ncbi:hypothetical protein RND71_012690 [Anisodus tanguticus]|uniref:L-dopachrome isomerase n=1 Tax=Anisodus tanguticus TaxID=243964 RepID=A0AAE1SGB8_9SOLA|nr:hypothetical protein RND71_012690 [Anisodus tanguticus]